MLSSDNNVFSGSLDTATWDDGLYLTRIHSTGDSNQVVSTELFAVRDGFKALPGRQIPVYTADIQVTMDSGNAQDKYTMTWFKNGVPVTTGITSPTFQVIKRDGTDLISSTSPSGMSVAQTQRFEYTASRESAEAQELGKNYVVKHTAQIDDATRSFSWILGRHDSGNA